MHLHVIVTPMRTDTRLFPSTGLSSVLRPLEVVGAIGEEGTRLLLLLLVLIELTVVHVYSNCFIFCV